MPPFQAEIDVNSTNDSNVSSLSAATKREPAGIDYGTATSTLKQLSKLKDEIDRAHSRPRSRAGSRARSRYSSSSKSSRKSRAEKIAGLVEDMNATMSEISEKLNASMTEVKLAQQGKAEQSMAHRPKTHTVYNPDERNNDMDNAMKERDLVFKRLIAEQDEMRMKLEKLKEARKSKDSRNLSESRRSTSRGGSRGPGGGSRGPEGESRGTKGGSAGDSRNLAKSHRSTSRGGSRDTKVGSRYDPRYIMGGSRGTTNGSTRTTSGVTHTTSGVTRTTSGVTRTTSGSTRTTSGSTRTTSGSTRTTSRSTRTTSGSTRTTSESTGEHASARANYRSAISVSKKLIRDSVEKQNQHAYDKASRHKMRSRGDVPSEETNGTADSSTGREQRTPRRMTPRRMTPRRMRFGWGSRK